MKYVITYPREFKNDAWIYHVETKKAGDVLTEVVTPFLKKATIYTEDSEVYLPKGSEGYFMKLSSAKKRD